MKCIGVRGGKRMEDKGNLAAEATGISISEQDQRDIHDLYSKLRAAEAKLVGPDGKTQVLPGSLYSFLCQLLADLKDGNSVTILQSEATDSFLFKRSKERRFLTTWWEHIAGFMLEMCLHIRATGMRAGELN
jgi:hypothetical protein